MATKRISTKVKPRESRISWDECFIQMAHVIADRSQDPSTQAGAIIVNENNVMVGAGYNGWPRGIEANALSWAREGDFEDTKYPYVCHAEENAVYNANNSTHGCKIYCTLFPCNECAKTIIQNGIKEVVYSSDKYKGSPQFNASRKLFTLAKVKMRQYNLKKKNEK
jgi:dCMP deaminase